MYRITAFISFDLHSSLPDHEALVGDDALHERARRYAREVCELLEGELVESTLETRVGIPVPVGPSQKNLL